MPAGLRRCCRTCGRAKAKLTELHLQNKVSSSPLIPPSLSGVLIVDKPAGFTSHDVVARVRKMLGIRQIGHFGTLDPFATGVLPLSIGKATRFAQFYLKSRKAYEGTLRFGFSTDTYDATGQPSSSTVEVNADRDHLDRIMQEFTGRIPQTPPPFSAKRVAGTRAYKLARQHKPFELSPVEVEVYALELLGLEGDCARFAVECSGGTYVRSLAHDIGKKLGCPAHLASLRRTAVAEFTDAQAVTLEALDKKIRQGEIEQCIIRLAALLPQFPELVVRGKEETNVRHGHRFELAQASRLGSPAAPSRAVSLLKILNSERQLIAVARHVEGNIYHPDLVLA
jgi:tRNA pseudouridine55 synthase